MEMRFGPPEAGVGVLRLGSQLLLGLSELLREPLPGAGDWPRLADLDIDLQFPSMVVAGVVGLGHVEGVVRRGCRALGFGPDDSKACFPIRTRQWRQ